MTRSMVETVLGAVVLSIAGYFLFFSYSTANVASSAGGYNIYADFAGVGGLKGGDDVQISGVKVGKVASVDLQPNTYLARVNINLNSDVKLPSDTAAVISSESLLGGRYLALQPGADEELLAPGGRIQYTQAPQSLEELLGKFIFSMSDSKKEEGGEVAQSGEAAPAEDESAAEEAVEPAPAPAPEAAPVEPAATEPAAAAEPEAPAETQDAPAETP